MFSMGDKNSFILFYELEEQTADFSDAQLGQLLRAIFEFEKRGNRPEISDIAVRTAFCFVAAQLDRSKAKYEDICAKRQESGKMGGRPSKSKGIDEKQNNQLLFKKAKKADNDNDPEREPERGPDPERDPDGEATASCPASRTNEMPTTALSVQETSQNNRNENIQEIVSFLNLTCGTNYRYTGGKTREKIIARLNEGFTLNDFKTVILKKHAEWGRDPKMSAYLRPETLFGTKFESYLNQPDRASSQSVGGALEKLYHQEKEAEHFDKT